MKSWKRWVYTVKGIRFKGKYDIASDKVFLVWILLKMLRICIQSPIEAVKVNYLIAALSICWLYNHVVHNEVAFDIRSLIFLYFGLRNLSESSPISSILKQNLYFVHLEFCRSDLDWVWLNFAISCWLVFDSTIGLPRRLLLSIKLFSKL